MLWIKFIKNLNQNQNLLWQKYRSDLTYATKLLLNSTRACEKLMQKEFTNEP